MPPSDVYGMGVTPDSVNITWSTDGIYWQPSQYQIIYCHKESLSKASLPMFGDKCGETNVTGHKGRHFAIISGLQPFSEYEFKVVGKMEGFAKETFTVANARTSKTFKKWIQSVKITCSSHVNNQIFFGFLSASKWLFCKNKQFYWHFLSILISIKNV